MHVALPTVDPWVSGLARLYDQQLRDTAAVYSNMGPGRARSAAHLDEFFFRLVSISRPRLFVEIGAYKAEASRRVKQALPDCRVVAFEANPYNFEHYAGQIDYAAEGVEYRNEAVADQPGHLTFHLRAAHDGQSMRKVTGNSSLLRRADDRTEYEQVEVAAVSLDAAFADDAGPICAWIDVEGASGAVLRGGPNFLGRCAVIKIEVEEKPMWEGQWLSLSVMELLLDVGFQPMARDIEYENQFNIVFVRNDFARRPEVLMAAELHGNYALHHLRDDPPTPPPATEPSTDAGPSADAGPEAPAETVTGAPAETGLLRRVFGRSGH